MKIYLASAYSRLGEMRNHASALKALGYTITSRWLHEDRSLPRHVRAQHDIDDILSSDILIRFTDTEALKMPSVAAGLVTGSRMWECGVAHHAGIPILVVGGYQAIFDWLPEINHFANLYEAIKWINKRIQDNMKEILQDA